VELVKKMSFNKYS